jgi:hypothetical protein
MTADTAVGVLCATVCPTCAETGGHLPPLAPSVAVTRVLEHCGHFGIDADQMADAMHAARA